MLTKDLIIFRRNYNNIKPTFIDTEDENLLLFAQELLDLYNPKQEPLHKDIDEVLKSLLNMQSNIKLAKGLNKIVLDNCKFNTPDEYDYIGHRKSIFAKSAELLRDKNTQEVDIYKEHLKESLDEEQEFLSCGLYSDLPENEKLIFRKKLFSREILERYNCSLVQSLLIYAGDIKLAIEDPDPAEIRKLFKYLKFFRLNSTITQDKKRPSMKGKLNIKIDGPSSILENSKKYGLQLASFFPAICNLTKWNIETIVNYKQNKYDLQLNQKSNLVSHYNNFSSYIPDEIKLFHKLFKEKSNDWKIVGDTPFIKVAGNDIVFPDLSFKKGKSKVIHLELFHRWHYAQLENRLDFCSKNPNIPLIIGVDRFLYRKRDLKDLLDSNDFFQNKGFLFSDFPITSAVIKCLENSI